MLVTTTTLEDYVVATNSLEGTPEGSILRYDKNTLTGCQPTCKIIFHNRYIYWSVIYMPQVSLRGLYSVVADLPCGYTKIVNSLTPLQY